MRVRSVFLPALIALTAPVFGAELSAACKPVYTAMEKTLQIDHATTSTNGASTTKGITAGGVLYVQQRGAWTKSRMSVKDAVALSHENLTNARQFTCQPLPDSSVNGVSVANYQTHTVNDGDVSDGLVSIDKHTGLAVRVDNDLHTGSHYVTEYTYGYVKAPM